MLEWFCCTVFVNTPHVFLVCLCLTVLPTLMEELPTLEATLNKCIIEYTRLKQEYEETQAELDRCLLAMENAVLRRRDISPLMASYEEAKKSERELGMPGGRCSNVSSHSVPSGQGKLPGRTAEVGLRHHNKDQRGCVF